MSASPSPAGRFITRERMILGVMAGLLTAGILVVRSVRSPTNRRDTVPASAGAGAQRPTTTARPAGATVAGLEYSSRVAEIVAQLDGGQDAPTGLEFKVSGDGGLERAPTRRVALLDELGRKNAKAAAVYAEKILRGFSSPDEWAVSLRDYALANPTLEGRVFLEEKMRTMLTHEPWHKNPSAGFLEAFDVAVYLGGTRLLPVLTDLVRLKDNPAVSYAAYLALDRLIINEPVPMFEHLLSHPEAMQGREVTRANYFARANVSDPAQKELLEKYLLDAQRSASELQTFAGLFPNFSFMVSANLLTRCATPDGATIAQRDREALRTVEAWLADPRFAPVESHLKTVRRRISQFVKLEPRLR